MDKHEWSGQADPIGGEKEYSELFHALRKFFEWNKCSYPEDLAQDTIYRGLQKIRQGTDIFAEDPKSYFKGIARMILLEQRKVRSMDPLEEPDTKPMPQGTRFQGMNETEMSILVEEQLRSLAPEERRFLLDYMNGVRNQSNLTPQVLRVRIHRLLRRIKNQTNL